jgi:hypothetical protein
MTEKDSENREECTASAARDEAVEVLNTLSTIRTQARICLADFQSLLNSLDKADDLIRQK